VPNRKKNETELYAKSSSSELQTERMSKKPLNTASRYSTVQLIKKTDVITDNELYKISTPVLKKKRNDIITDNELYESSKPVEKKIKRTNIITDNELYSNTNLPDSEKQKKESRKYAKDISIRNEEITTEENPNRNKKHESSKKSASKLQISYYEESCL